MALLLIRARPCAHLRNLTHPRKTLAAGDDCGAAYVYRFDGAFWLEEQKLIASDAAAGDLFGISVSVSGDTAVVGARGDSCVAGVQTATLSAEWSFGFEIGQRSDRISTLEAANGKCRLRASGYSAAIAGPLQ